MILGFSESIAEAVNPVTAVIVAEAMRIINLAMRN